MKIHVILAQRKCRYEGEYAPEALEVADEYAMDDNPDWFYNKLDEYRQDKSFQSVEAIIIKIPDNEIDAILKPKVLEINGEIVK